MLSIVVVGMWLELEVLRCIKQRRVGITKKVRITVTASSIEATNFSSLPLQHI